MRNGLVTTGPKPTNLTVVNVTQCRVVSIQPIDEPGIYPHSFSKGWIGRDPMCNASTLRTAVKR
jgi:hypothetical protein